MPEKKVIIVMPVIGKPYIAQDKDCDKLKDLQEIVGGYIELCNNSYTVIHPMFETEKRWKAVSDLKNKLRKNQYKIYCNENGTHTEVANMAVLNANPHFGVRPLFGIVCMVLKEKLIEGYELPYKNFMEDEDETEDEEEQDAFFDEFINSK
jgi:hypothetical protein